MALDKESLDALRIDDAERNAGGALRVVGWLALVVVLVGAGVGAALRFAGSGTAPDAEPQIRTVQAARPRADDAGVLDASGYVVARRLATVSSKVTGRIEEVFIEEGTSVEQGELLARLDASSVRPQLDLARAQLDSARRGLAETQVRLGEARRQLVRSQRLREQKLVSEAALDAAQAEVDALEARLDATRASVVVAQRTVALREQDLADLEIRAPFAGVVVAKNAQPGEMISPISAGGGFTRTGIGTIVDMDSREIEVDVNEAFINRVDAGQRIIARLDAYSDWDIAGSVINIVPTADRQRATVKVRIAFDELDPRILPDMGVKVSFLDNAPEQSGESVPVRATVPASAVRSDGATDYVWLVRDGRLERRAVTPAQRSGNTVGIVAGLAPGDRVVTDANVELEQGKQVGDN